MVKLIFYVFVVGFLNFHQLIAGVKVHYHSFEALGLIKDLDKLSFRSQEARENSIREIEAYILSHQEFFIPDHEQNPLKIKFESMTTFRNRTTVRFSQMLAGKKDIPIIGASIIASIDEMGKLESLNSSLIETVSIPKTFQITFSKDLNSSDAIKKDTDLELKKLFEAIIEFESIKFEQWVIKTTRDNKISLLTDSGEQYDGTPLEFIKESEKNLKTFISQLSKISILRLFITFSNENKITLVVQKYPDGEKEILWRIMAPFDVPIQVDIDATKDTLMIKRVLSLIIFFKADVYKASRLWPLKNGNLKISASSSDEITILSEANQGNPAPQAQSQSFFQSGPKSWDYAAYNFLRVKEFFEDKYSFNSYDNNGIDMSVLVDIKLPMLSENAAWLGAGFNKFLLGRGGESLDDFEKAIDILAHEYTHAIHQFSVNLLNFGEPGGIAEHTCDIMGIAAEKAINGDLNFQVGELVLISPFYKSMGKAAVRDLESPFASLSPQPKSMSELMEMGYTKDCKPTVENDKCYVHTSTGVLSYPIVRAIKKIGLEHFDSVVELIFTTSLLRLRFDSDFQDYYTQLLDEWDRQIGILSGISSDSCTIIKEEFNIAGITEDMNLKLGDSSKAMKEAIAELCQVYRENKIPLPPYCN